MTTCPDCRGEGFDLKAAIQPSTCQTCAGYGNIYTREEIERRAKAHRERTPEEPLPGPGYWGDRAWRISYGNE